MHTKNSFRLNAKVLANEDTLLRTHCCSWCFLGCANWETFVADRKCFWTKSETFLCPGHKICVRNKCCACGQTGKHLCRQQCVRNNASSFASTLTLSSPYFVIQSQNQTKLNRDWCENVFPGLPAATALWVLIGSLKCLCNMFQVFQLLARLTLVFVSRHSIENCSLDVPLIAGLLACSSFPAKQSLSKPRDRLLKGHSKTQSAGAHAYYIPFRS